MSATACADISGGRCQRANYKQRFKQEPLSSSPHPVYMHQL